MAIKTDGLHHVTAIGGNPRRNVDFYARTLGLRLVKTTVNFDDPGVYHLYYGDAEGTPGTLMTLFPWGGVTPGRQGTGQATTTSFSIPELSLGWWEGHLKKVGVESTRSGIPGEEEALTFLDPDGLRLSLVAHPQGDPRDPWDTPLVPAEYAIRGLHSVTMQVAEEDASADMLTDGLGLRLVGEHGDQIQSALPRLNLPTENNPEAQRV